MAPAFEHDPLFGFPRQAHRGRTFVYLLRCRGEDLLKVGFSHDPIGRFHTLHPKFYTFFDLDHSLLIETEHLKEARRLERLFIEQWHELNAPAPLVINPRAGGHSEWFRGAGDSLMPMVERLAERYGFPVHSPLRAWLRQRLLERADLLFAWSEHMHQIIDWQEHNQNAPMRDPIYANGLRDALDALEAVGIDSKPWIPEAVHQWYLTNRARP